MSNKRQKKKITLVMPTQVEIMKSVRGAPIPPKKVMRPKKGGGYNRNEEKRRSRRNSH